ncbi:hypothetical protein QQP08_014418 [Theobroma cacao]|nr:hypothetical protein QQP08_014418 [Theobroma cacao]
MEFPKATTLSKISLVFVIVFISCTAQFGAAIRPFHEEQVLLKKIIPNLESLQMGPVPPSDHSHCSNIPGTGQCGLNEMNIAGRHIPSPPPFPGNGMDVKRFAAAAAAAATSMENKSNN